MSSVAEPLDELRIALGEVDILAKLTAAAYDSADWNESDPDVVDGIASLLGLIVKSASAGMSAFHRLHGAIADAAPVPATAPTERWDHEGKGTAPGGQVAMSAEDAAIVRRLREVLAERFGQPVNHPFFSQIYEPGEDPDAALLRLFKRNKRVMGWSDEDVLATMGQREPTP